MEVHVQLATRSKMFCACPTDYLGRPPNTSVCPVCLGLPGVLPVINKRAVELCLKSALALNCTVQDFTKFDRKNYFYPDLPKGYQISQYDLPMSRDGWLELEGKRVGIRRVHLEEDTGKLVHAGDRLHLAGTSFVDLNRSGVPLMEIVSEPDIGSAAEARDYAIALRAIMRAIGASEADMAICGWNRTCRYEAPARRSWASRPSSRTSIRSAPCISPSSTRSSAR
jgi:aspartyl-tRNA(Asn)/glutamyl-tRNA(Gln) amidotransferase subunit B